MRIRFHFNLVAVGFLLVSCASDPATAGKPKAVTFDQLHLASRRFDCSRVLVIGFLLQPMVGDVTLNQSEPDYHHYVPGTGIRLDLNPQQRNLMPFQLKRCAVEGTFHASPAPGVRDGIGEITRLELAERSF